MRTRAEIYQEILAWGLLHIRDAACASHVRLCEIEADHRHNIPSLIDESNERRHECYVGQERALFLERLEALVSPIPDRTGLTMARYRELWTELETSANFR